METKQIDINGVTYTYCKYYKIFKVEDDIQQEESWPDSNFILSYKSSKLIRVDTGDRKFYSEEEAMSYLMSNTLTKDISFADEFVILSVTQLIGTEAKPKQIK